MRDMLRHCRVTSSLCVIYSTPTLPVHTRTRSRTHLYIPHQRTPLQTMLHRPTHPDAIAIVLFHSFRDLYTGSDHQSHLRDFTIPLSMGSFLSTSVGSVLVGVCTGFVCSWICKHTGIRHHPHHELTLLFLFAYLAYAFAEVVEVRDRSALWRGSAQMLLCGVQRYGEVQCVWCAGFNPCIPSCCSCACVCAAENACARTAVGYHGPFLLWHGSRALQRIQPFARVAQHSRGSV